MTQELQTWPRERYESGGGDAYLTYYIYGNFDPLPAVASDLYRCAGVPTGVEIRRLRSNEHHDSFSAFLQGVFGRLLYETLPNVAQRVEHSPDCLVIAGTVADPPTLDYLRDIVGLLTCFLDKSGIAMVDPQTLAWYSPGTWRHQVFEPALQALARHAVILKSIDSEQPGTNWLHTRGMRKFGRPDLSIRRVTPENESAVADMLQRFIEFQTDGAVIPEGAPIRMAALPEGMTCHHGGDVDDPDFNNVHVEIRWPGN